MMNEDLIKTQLAYEKERLAVSLFANKSPSSSPYGLILGGQPASGKTQLIRFLKTSKDFGENIVVINGDEFRVLHPYYLQICQQYDREAPNYTQAFANELVEFIKKKCLSEKYNFIIEGTMRSYQTIEKTLFELIEFGFKAELHVLAVPFEKSLIGIFERYEYDKARTGIGRFSPLNVHKEAFENIPSNLTEVKTHFPQVKIYFYEHFKEELIAFNYYVSYGIFESVRKNQPFNREELLTRWNQIAEMANLRLEANKEYKDFILNQLSYYSK